MPLLVLVHLVRIFSTFAISVYCTIVNNAVCFRVRDRIEQATREHAARARADDRTAATYFRRRSLPLRLPQSVRIASVHCFQLLYTGL